MGSDGPWPAYGEIDIMESYQALLLANVCWGGDKDGQPNWVISQCPATGLGLSWATHFHTWSMDWSPSSIRLSVDGRLLNTIELVSTTNDPRLEPHNPLELPHYLLLTLAVGGNNGVDPSHAGFPVRFGVDYVRVYQRAMQD